MTNDPGQPHECWIGSGPIFVRILSRFERIRKAKRLPGPELPASRAAVLAISLIALIREASAGWREETLLFAATCFAYGIGRGFVTAPLFNTVLSGVPARDAGAASGVTSTMQQVANSVGIAVIGAIVFSVISTSPRPADYAHGFVITGIINLGMLAFASALLFFIPKSRGRDIPSLEPLLVEG